MEFYIHPADRYDRNVCPECGRRGRGKGDAEGKGDSRLRIKMNGKEAKPIQNRGGKLELCREISL